MQALVLDQIITVTNLHRGKISFLTVKLGPGNRFPPYGPLVDFLGRSALCSMDGSIPLEMGAISRASLQHGLVCYSAPRKWMEW